MNNQKTDLLSKVVPESHGQTLWGMPSPACSSALSNLEMLFLSRVWAAGK